MNKERSYYWTMAFILPLFTTIVLMLSGCANSPSTENAKSPVIERPTKKLHFSGLVGVACNQDNDCNGDCQTRNFFIPKKIIQSNRGQNCQQWIQDNAIADKIQKVFLNNGSTKNKNKDGQRKY